MHIHNNNKHLIIFLLMLFSQLSQAQLQDKVVININSDSRYIGNIKADNPYEPTGFLQDLTLGIEWWTLLGEPVEIYSILWNSTNSYKIEVDGVVKTISKEQVTKYPDLLKRFNNIRPYKIDLIVYGHGDGITTSLKRGNFSASHSKFYRKGDAYKTKGQSYDPYTLSAHIAYKVPDAKLLVSKSGETSKTPVAESPRTWNYFLGWKQRTSNSNAPTADFDYLVTNKSETEYKALSKEKQKELDRELKQLYLNTTSFTLSVTIDNIEWPENEMKSIARLYADYESGKKEPSPFEEVAMAEENMQDVDKYTKDDFWGDVAEVEKPELEIFQEGKLYGVRYKNSNNIIIPSIYYGIHSLHIRDYNYDKGTGIFRRPETNIKFFVCQIKPYRISGELEDDENTNIRILIDSNGKIVINEPFYLAVLEIGDLQRYEILNRKSKKGGEIIALRFIDHYISYTSKWGKDVMRNHEETTVYDLDFTVTFKHYASESSDGPGYFELIKY